ncbi:putative colanic acid biosynthesis acetyltransferase [Cellulophaga sp. HaHaR_3_176]|uniref:putative colanic acid biosynthesis acetyltransferase n=1 Tax=Cellulophaga sp. HaHaR_3_176 TaxID=1942464 RepID=UPI001C1F9A1F|nr:putative colanic acid biosynthesis acetyltransferase [Cellulophaga sp. HaHaR_3_176]QWX83335.1 putative colanic acid biosynthesis acetyltransferase [Cellulophaga sp. HaHaR_3_176]
MHNQDTYTGASFSLKNRISRVIWNTTYLFLFKYSPRPFHSWRSFLLKLFGAKIGKGVHIYPKVKIWAPWNLVIHDEVGVADGVDLYSQGKITLEHRAIISQRSYICTGTHDFNQKGHPLYTQDICIGRNAWVAAEAFIGPGVTVNEGAVVGARAAVFKDVPSWTVVGGNPAKFIKNRQTLN